VRAALIGSSAGSVDSPGHLSDVGGDAGDVQLGPKRARCPHGQGGDDCGQGPRVVIAMAAARVNRMPITCCDRRGVERERRWTEASTIIGADGWPLATADAHGVVWAELDLRQSKNKHISPRNDVHADRRPDIYRQTGPDGY
jgi:predicted amidohydrolase